MQLPESVLSQSAETSPAFELYSGRVEQTGRFWQMPAQSCLWRDDFSPLFKFSWYDDILNEIRLMQQALQAAEAQRTLDATPAESVRDTAVSENADIVTTPLQAAMKVQFAAISPDAGTAKSSQQPTSPPRTHSKAVQTSDAVADAVAEDGTRKRKRASQSQSKESDLWYLKAQAAEIGVPATGTESAGDLCAKIEAMRVLRANVDAGCVYYQLAGTSGLGKATFGKRLIYELCGCLDASQRPDVLYVYRDEYHDRTMPYSLQTLKGGAYMELLYYKDGAPQLHRLHKSLREIPLSFWSLRDPTRPLYVVIDTFPPMQVLDTIKAGNAAWFDSMQLCVYLASEANLCTAQQFCGRERTWPFPNIRTVPSMSEEDYLLCGYVCANERTRKFLCSTAGIAAGSDAGGNTTPESVIPVLKYIYHVMGGSPLHLLQFAVKSHSQCFYRAYQKETLLDTLKSATRGYRINPALREAVHNMCHEHISLRADSHVDMTPDEIAALFYRLVVDEDVSEYHACRQCRRVYASAVMEAVVLRLLKDRGTARKLKREFMGYIGEIELADIMELSEEQRKVLVLGLTMKGLFIL